jgi:hypothetical protein
LKNDNFILCRRRDRNYNEKDHAKKINEIFFHVHGKNLP